MREHVGEPVLVQPLGDRADPSAAPRERLEVALAELDRVFEKVTGRPATRGEGHGGEGRTIAYRRARWSAPAGELPGDRKSVV